MTDSRRDFSLDEAMAMLARTPPMLEAWLRGVPDGWLRSNEGGETWSPFDVLGHLLHGEQTDWIPRLQLILAAGEQRAFEPFDRFAQFAASAGKSVPDLLAQFSVARARNLETLASLSLTEADLDRCGRHPALGSVTARALLATWVAHDLDHVAQIARVLARQYADAVGPWRAYLRVISGQPG